MFGVGRLGLCVALCLEEAGYDVLGIDVHPAYVEKLNQRTFISHEPSVSEMLQEATHFRATVDPEEGVNFADILMIMVATPSTGGDRHYDHSTVNKVLRKMARLKIAQKHVIIGCTVMPGYIRNVARYILKECIDVTVSYSPEFIAQGDIVRGLKNPDLILIGAENPVAGDLLEEMYSRISGLRQDHFPPSILPKEPKICRMSAESAEIAKLSINCFVTTKISFANMIGDIADRSAGANKFDILECVGADSRIGPKYLKPGYGFGGPCFPRDNRALAGHAEAVGVDAMIPQATDRYNKYHAKMMADELKAEDKDVYVFKDVAFKEKCPVPQIEESQKLEVARQVAASQKRVIIEDRKMILDVVQEEFGYLFEYKESEDGRKD